MENNSTETKKLRISKLVMVLSAIIACLAGICLFYSLVHRIGDIVVYFIFAVALVICAGIFIYGMITSIQESKELNEKGFNDLIKSNKDFYLLIKKYFELYDEKLATFDNLDKKIIEELVYNQKMAAKVTINKSKENLNKVIEDSNSIVALKRDIRDINDKLNELSASIKSISFAPQPQQVTYVSESAIKDNVNVDVDVEAETKDILESLLEEFEAERENETVEENIESDVDLAVGIDFEEEPVSLEEPGEDNLDLEQLLAGLEEEASLGKQDEDIAEDFPLSDLMFETPLEEESVLEPLPEPIIESIPEPIPEPEVVKEEAPIPSFDMGSDPNKKLTPEEIAALVASMTN